MRPSPLILLVDDEPPIIQVMSITLTPAGYDIITARDGEEGLTLALNHKPDLIITDYQMPFITGLELSRELTQHQQTAAIPPTPILMLTARGFSIDPACLHQTNILAMLGKPFSPREVLATVRRLIADPASRQRKAS